MGFFETIIQAIGNFFTKAKPIIEDIFTKANSIVNIVKSFEASPGGQTIIAILEAFAPGASNVVIGLLNEFFVAFGIVDKAVVAEGTKTQAEIASDGLAAVAKLTGNAKVIALQNIASLIGHGISTVNGTGTTLQQATILAPLAHNPGLLSDAQPTPQVGSIDANGNTILP